MPPHCDFLDGPVVTAAREALDARDVDLVLPFVPADAEDEVRQTFERVMPLRDLGATARGVGDQLFFETVVRLHRVGEGAPYDGLRPAGHTVGPVIPLAERAVAGGSTEQLANYLADALRWELATRLESIHHLAGPEDRSVPALRRYVDAVHSFEEYSHQLYEAIRSPVAHRRGTPLLTQNG